MRRTAAFAATLASTALVSASFIGTYADTLFWVRAVQLTAAFMIIPMFAALSRPLTLIAEYAKLTRSATGRHRRRECTCLGTASAARRAAPHHPPHVRAGRVARTINGPPGVLVVPVRHRVYATATDTNEVAVIDETTGTVLHHTPTGAYPDGLAYDPVQGPVWTSN
ncbi:hypothetical protein AS200_44675 (plasmid) [Streptomyces sp. CdTB01]|nr:hypothetical protein AS200_44675 [Streptomyces sp. CdTB01]